MALKTIAEEITVTDQLGNAHRFAPSLKDNTCGVERNIVVPIKVKFSEGRVVFEDRQESFNLQQCNIEVRPYDRKGDLTAYSCTG